MYKSVDLTSYENTALQQMFFEIPTYTFLVVVLSFVFSWYQLYVNLRTYVIAGSPSSILDGEKIDTEDLTDSDVSDTVSKSSQSSVVDLDHMDSYREDNAPW